MKRRLLSLMLALACVLSLCTFGSIAGTEVQAAEGIPDIMLYEDYPSSKEFQISTCYGLQKFSAKRSVKLWQRRSNQSKIGAAVMPPLNKFIGSVNHSLSLCSNFAQTLASPMGEVSRMRRRGQQGVLNPHTFRSRHRTIRRASYPQLAGAETDDLNKLT